MQETSTIRSSERTLVHFFPVFNTLHFQLFHLRVFERVMFREQAKPVRYKTTHHEILRSAPVLQDSDHAYLKLDISRLCCGGCSFFVLLLLNPYANRNIEEMTVWFCSIVLRIVMAWYLHRRCGEMFAQCYNKHVGWIYVKWQVPQRWSLDRTQGLI